MNIFKLILRILHWITKPFSSCSDGCCKGYDPVVDVFENLKKDK